ncbi:DUF1294 domain-containing protein [Vibrio makurazakiensis]|uniref:DUF1294 domain-containing protein n=1 Tax=Vibrio makurazakiensis TaxID=2910250 RepID=UPI003D137816
MGSERTVLQWEGGIRKNSANPLNSQDSLVQRDLVHHDVDSKRRAAIFDQSAKEKSSTSSVSPFVFNFSMAIVVWFITVLLASIWLVKYPPIVLLFYVFLSAVTYSFYMFDSAAAKQNTLRIHNGILHTLSLAGGWPGALIAQCSYKVHYHNKVFAVLFWCTVGLNFLVYVWTFTEAGNAHLLSWVRELKLWLSPV